MKNSHNLFSPVAPGLSEVEWLRRGLFLNKCLPCDLSADLSGVALAKSEDLSKAEALSFRTKKGHSRKACPERSRRIAGIHYLVYCPLKS